ncbi:hypothetical protein JSY14_05990 [Brachybacterium sp. EF45031]|uniref:hypothetical protein n=1 Tax=Brachybacterium sillae TaxID=2810536 RepID=UPI00217E65DC|nr:hypothetical protein [Brachybacterium sillae]MCS6711597.1 hypothetical protein [Brachybacterium sillae]
MTTQQEQQQSASKRNRTATVTILGLIVVAGVLGAAALFGGLFPRSATTHPPCDELPTSQEVDAALAAHSELAEQLTAQGTEITVQVANPCTDAPDAALIQVNYATDQERTKIDQVLTNADGFGVPVYVVKK